MLRIIAPLIWISAFCGCAHLPTAQVDSSELQLRNNAASLLYDLLGDEKNVSKIFVVKDGGEKVEGLIKAISKTADENAKKLDQLAQSDLQLNLKVLNLPPGEKAARDATAKSKEHDLLFSSGANFEFNLLLTQAEAQNYGWHLAKVAAENSPRADEAQTFKDIAETMKLLYEQTVRQMRTLPRP